MKKRRQTYFQGWRLYPLCCLGHHMQGAVVAAVLLTGSMNNIITAMFWAVLYIAYQGLSVLRKEDSPGLDIADFMMGAGAGIVIVVLAGMLP